jgi:hypothetical protein
MSDLSQIFSTEDGFAVTALVDGSMHVNGIFDRSYVDANGVATNSSAFTCASEDLELVSMGAALTVQGVEYRAAGIEHDGTGVALVRLTRV